MNKLIQAVGVVLEKEGYTGLSIANIAQAAGVDRKLITVYFGSVNNLIETYIKDKDYWISITENVEARMAGYENASTRVYLETMILEQMAHFAKDEEMQKVVTWQISEHSDIMSHVTQAREQISSLFFPIADKELVGRDVDLRAVSGILVSAVYYLVLHAKYTDSTVCEIDIRTEEGMSRIREAIKFILKATYGE